MVVFIISKDARFFNMLAAQHFIVAYEASIVCDGRGKQ
jgi:hypothetical protein